MPDSIEDKLKKAKQLRDEAKFKESLEMTSILEKTGNVSPESNLNCQILKGEIFFWLGRYGETLEICEQAYQESQRIGTDVQSFDALIFKLLVLWDLGDINQFQERMLVVEKILNSITEKPSKEFDRRKAIFNWERNCVCNLKGENKKGLELNMESLGFYEESDDNS